MPLSVCDWLELTLSPLPQMGISTVEMGTPVYQAASWLQPIESTHRDRDRQKEERVKRRERFLTKVIKSPGQMAWNKAGFQEKVRALHC